MEWIAYLARAAGAAVMAIVGLSFVLAALLVDEGRLLSGAMGLAACFGSWFTWPRSPNAWRRDQPTAKQLRYAADLGIRVRRGATKGEVSDAISSVTGR